MLRIVKLIAKLIMLSHFLGCGWMALASWAMSHEADGERARTFNTRESLFGAAATDYDQLAVITKNFEPYKDLWLVAHDWQRCQREWLDGPLLKLDPDEVEKSFTTWTRSMAKALKTFKELAVGSIAKTIKQEMEDFRPFLPVVVALRNPGMRERHWTELTKLTGQQGLLEATDRAFTLTKLKTLGLEDHLEPVTKVWVETH